MPERPGLFPGIHKKNPRCQVSTGATMFLLTPLAPLLRLRGEVSGLLVKNILKIDLDLVLVAIFRKGKLLDQQIASGI